MSDGTRTLYEDDDLPPEAGETTPEPAVEDAPRAPDVGGTPPRPQKGPAKSPKNLSKAPEYVRTLAQHARYLPALAAATVIVLDFLLVLGAALRDGLEAVSAKHGGAAALSAES